MELTKEERFVLTLIDYSGIDDTLREMILEDGKSPDHIAERWGVDVDMDKAKLKKIIDKLIKLGLVESSDLGHGMCYTKKFRQEH